MALAVRFDFVYVGTCTHTTPDGRGRAEGIYICKFDRASGHLEIVKTVQGVINPSFLTTSADHKFLYAVNETSGFTGQTDGSVSAFAVDSMSGALTLLNTQPTLGASPCYISINKTGQWAFTANYFGGSVTVLPIELDGQLGGPTVYQHHGHSIHPKRQTAPHAHSIISDPDDQYIVAADLGLDRIFVYRLDTQTGHLLPNMMPEIKTTPGSGPRHLAFHPNGRYLYVVNELDSTVSVYDYDPSGNFGFVQNYSTLPSDFSGANLSADIHIAPSGKFLYVSNRGYNGITVFAIDYKTGYLSNAAYFASEGQSPRNFTFDTTGNWLLVANEGSDNVTVFKVDMQSGALFPTGRRLAVPAPACVTFR